jgi:hypothetical protein
MTTHHEAILDQFTRQAVPFRDSLANDDLGMGVGRVGDEIHFGYPVAVLAARR